MLLVLSAVPCAMEPGIQPAVFLYTINSIALMPFYISYVIVVTIIVDTIKDFSCSVAVNFAS